MSSNNIHRCSRTHEVVYVLITNKYATYKELRDDYSIEEVIDLYEICLVNLYNKQEINETVKENLKWQRNTQKR